MSEEPKPSPAKSFADFLYKFYFDKLFKEGYSRSDIGRLSVIFSKFTLEQTNAPKELVDETIKILNDY